IHTERIEDVRLHAETYHINQENAAKLDAAGRRVAVGTTSVRTMEAVRRIGALSGQTDLFIYPGFDFQRTGALLTNFHLPRSSLLVLACAFGGTSLVLAAYQHAVEQKYRFYSYGDCMLII